MYNSFLYDNRVRNEQQRRDSSAKFKAWEKKHNDSKGQLARKYHARVENFVIRINQQPIEIKAGDEDLLGLIAHYRENGRFMHFSNNDFYHKSRSSTKNLKTLPRAKSTHMTRNELVQGNSRTMQMQTKQGRSLASQSDYQPFLHDFRQRNKQKQIQKTPMRYNFISRAIPNDQRRIYTTSRYRRIKNLNHPNKFENSKSHTQHQSSDKKGSQMNEDDVMSMLSKLVKPMVNSGKGIGPKLLRFNSFDGGQPEERVRISTQPSKGKMHFKAAMELACYQTSTMGKAARQGLQKCKFAKFTDNQTSQQRDSMLFNQ